MKLFLAGATGAIGRPLTSRLIARGHEVLALSRSDANDAAITAAGARPVRVPLDDAAALAPHLGGVDVVLRVATHIPATAAPTAADWAANDHIRRAGTRALLDASLRAGVGRYVQESVVWLARPPDGAPFDEHSPPQPDDVTRSAFDAEEMAAKADLQAATVRLGWLYGAHTAHTRGFAAALRAGHFPVPRPDTTPLAFLHVDDAVGAFVAAAEGNATGVFHAVPDAPTATGEYFDAFARGVGAPRPARIDAAPGGFLTTPMRTSGARMAQAFGWRARVADAAVGIEKVAREIATTS